MEETGGANDLVSQTAHAFIPEPKFKKASAGSNRLAGWVRGPCPAMGFVFVSSRLGAKNIFQRLWLLKIKQLIQ
ncbi:MAG TPA: hypothetical protein DDZ88_20155 [Verrucomicrobiales bacterium]|nr:hypothetical protein [Verrucomicrobiales bacterium]